MIRLALLVLALPAFAPLASADRLITTDGRVLEVKKARQLPNGNYVLTFGSGTIEVPSSSVASVEIEGDMSDYVPRNADEARKLEKGFVRFEGKWLSKASYENELKKRSEAARERVEDLAAHSIFYNGWEEETRHFIVKTNSSEELLEYYCELLEAYYKLVDNEFGINPTPTLRRKKMQVNIYKSRRDFYEETGMGGGVLGFFRPTTQDLHFYHDFNDPGLSTWVALHEATHLLTFLIDPQNDPGIWYNEGIADYYGSSEVTVDERGRVTITPGAPQLDRILTVQQAIADEKHVGLEKLFRIKDHNFSGFEYAHAWSFIYFLNKTDDYRKGFERFFDDVYTLPKGVEYSNEISGRNTGYMVKVIAPEEVRRVLLDNLRIEDVGELEREWIAFVKDIEISSPDALFRRGYNALRRGNSEQFEQAEKDLDRALEAGCEDPTAFWARGLLRSINARAGLKAGLSDLKKATELAPLDPRFRFSYGQALAGYQLDAGAYSMGVGDADGDAELHGKPEEFEEAELQLGLACELDPGNTFYLEFFEEFERLFGEYLERQGD